MNLQYSIECLEQMIAGMKRDNVLSYYGMSLEMLEQILSQLKG